MYRNLKEFSQSKTFQGVLIGIGLAVVVLLIFQAGIFVGYHKAAFSYRMGDNYYRAFGDRGPRPLHVPLQDGFAEAYGAIGKIVSLNLPTFVVTGPDEIEKVIVVGDDTRIRRFDATIPATDLKVGDFTVILGSPNENSQIESKLIRILPAPPDMEKLNR